MNKEDINAIIENAIVVDPKDGLLSVPEMVGGVVGAEEALEYFTEKFNAARTDLNNFEQACYMEVITLLETELMRERKIGN